MCQASYTCVDASVQHVHFFFVFDFDLMMKKILLKFGTIDHLHFDTPRKLIRMTFQDRSMSISFVYRKLSCFLQYLYFLLFVDDERTESTVLPKIFPQYMMISIFQASFVNVISITGPKTYKTSLQVIVLRQFHGQIWRHSAAGTCDTQKFQYTYRGRDTNVIFLLLRTGSPYKSIKLSMENRDSTLG